MYCKFGFFAQYVAYSGCSHPCKKNAFVFFSPAFLVTACSLPCLWGLRKCFFCYFRNVVSPFDGAFLYSDDGKKVTSRGRSSCYCCGSDILYRGKGVEREEDRRRKKCFLSYSSVNCGRSRKQGKRFRYLLFLVEKRRRNREIILHSLESRPVGGVPMALKSFSSP